VPSSIVKTCWRVFEGTVFVEKGVAYCAISLAETIAFTQQLEN